VLVHGDVVERQLQLVDMQGDKSPERVAAELMVNFMAASLMRWKAGAEFVRFRARR
jgi:hypothetical protein